MGNAEVMKGLLRRKEFFLKKKLIIVLLIINHPTTFFTFVNNVLFFQFIEHLMCNIECFLKLKKESFFFKSTSFFKSLMYNFSFLQNFKSSVQWENASFQLAHKVNYLLLMLHLVKV